MKKHLVILTGIYFPQPSATGLVTKRYAKLLEGEYDIDVIFLQASVEKIHAVREDGFRLFGVCGNRMLAEFNASGIKHKLIHSLGQLEILTKRYGNMSWYKKKAIEKLDQINQESQIDIIFSICSPFQAHLAGIEFKKKYPKIKHVAFTVDLYAVKNKIRPFYVTYKSSVQEEKEVFELVDYLLLSEEIYNTRPDLYKNVSHCAKLPYVMPTYNFDCSEKKYFFEEGIHCVYAGRFYKDMRNPEYMLRLFNQLKNDKIKLHLFSVGCEDIVNKFKCGNIILHSQVVNNEIYKVYQEADVLIGIGNNLPEFLPSKTFEYIASCKPILFFNQGTEINNVINEYPLSIQISMSADIQANSEIILNTLPGFKGRSVDIQNINSIYTVNSPEFVKRILLKAIE